VAPLITHLHVLFAVFYSLSVVQTADATADSRHLALSTRAIDAAQVSTQQICRPFVNLRTRSDVLFRKTNEYFQHRRAIFTPYSQSLYIYIYDDFMALARRITTLMQIVKL
jgi:hypothetical protein